MVKMETVKQNEKKDEKPREYDSAWKDVIEELAAEAH